MGHDIYGINKAGAEIAYARFSMGNYNATILYRLLEAEMFYAGVSGSGGSTTFTVEQIEKALRTYYTLYKKDVSQLNNDSIGWDQKQILIFIKNCLATAQKEGRVRVYFG
ncbi:hypothetical protein GCM10008967_18940 [Bacillus carboniphilus]|uniref:Uncharacterized protein n=1 Tax=Bacillus carboniphilus TaxID=86663 RepID=A0ABP3FYH1_9BACI